MSRKFCKNQIQCSDRPKEIYSCMGHLAEGHVHDCTYNESQIYLDSYEYRGETINRFKIAKIFLGHCYSGICEDFDILLGVEKNYLLNINCE